MRLVDDVVARYHRWEAKIAGHLRDWSVRRRWVVLVLLPALVCGCGGTVIGGPLVWIADATVAAGKGAPDSQAAVNIYLLALSYDNDAGLLPIVGNDENLMRQWNAYRTDMQLGDGAPTKLEFTFGPTTHPDSRHAQVDADVYGVWWSSTNGRLSGYNSPAHPWHFGLRDDDGWRIERVAPYAWCGGYVTTEGCG
jgi:hypothetical protein